MERKCGPNLSLVHYILGMGNQQGETGALSEDESMQEVGGWSGPLYPMLLVSEGR